MWCMETTLKNSNIYSWDNLQTSSKFQIDVITRIEWEKKGKRHEQGGRERLFRNSILKVQLATWLSEKQINPYDWRGVVCDIKWGLSEEYWNGDEENVRKKKKTVENEWRCFFRISNVCVRFSMDFLKTMKLFVLSRIC